MPVPTPLARAVKNWLEALPGAHATGQLARGIREVLLGLDGGDSRQLADGLEAQMKAVRALVKRAEKREGGGDGSGEGSGSGGPSLH